MTSLCQENSLEILRFKLKLQCGVASTGQRQLYPAISGHPPVSLSQPWRSRRREPGLGKCPSCLAGGWLRLDCCLGITSVFWGGGFQRDGIGTGLDARGVFLRDHDNLFRDKCSDQIVPIHRHHSNAMDNGTTPSIPFHDPSHPIAVALHPGGCRRCQRIPVPLLGPASEPMIQLLKISTWTHPKQNPQDPWIVDVSCKTGRARQVGTRKRHQPHLVLLPPSLMTLDEASDDLGGAETWSQQQIDNYKQRVIMPGGRKHVRASVCSAHFIMSRPAKSRCGGTRLGSLGSLCLHHLHR